MSFLEILERLFARDILHFLHFRKDAERGREREHFCFRGAREKVHVHINFALYFFERGGQCRRKEDDASYDEKRDGHDEYRGKRNKAVSIETHKTCLDYALS